jgi:hypothetical protein
VIHAVRMAKYYVVWEALSLQRHVECTHGSVRTDRELHYNEARAVTASLITF